MSRPQWFFVINPVSGKGQGQGIWQQLRQQLVTNDLYFDHAISSYHQHVLALVAEKYREGFRHFIGIGGDGTLNEMVNAVFQAAAGAPDENCVLGLIAVGTGNDWVRSQKNQLTILNLIEKLERINVEKHDVGVIQSDELKRPYYFLNVAGAGLDGKVVQEIAGKATKGKKGKWAYLTGLIQALFTYTAPEVVVSLAHKPFFTGLPLVITAAKGRYFGGNMEISPEAKPDNQLLDCTIIKKVPKRKILPQIYKLFNSQISKVSFVYKGSSHELAIQSASPLAVQADGELVGELAAFQFLIAERQVNILS